MACTTVREAVASLRVRLGVPALVLLLLILAFLPALQGDFLAWDDRPLLLDNTRYQSIDSASLYWMFTTSLGGHFQPLTWLTYSIDWAIWDYNAFGYRLANVLWHAATALAFYFLSRQLIVVGWGLRWGVRSKPVVLAAGLAAALFAVHPLRVESVAWISERRDVVSGFFFVLSLWFYLKYAGAQRTMPPLRRARDGRADGRWWYVFSIVGCLLSLLAKASAMTLPFVLLVLDVYPLRRFGGKTGRSARRLVLEKLPFLVLAVAAAVRAVAGQDRGGALYGWSDHDLLARCAQACYGLVFYIGKTVWPTNLGPLYEIPSRDVLLGSMFWLSLLGCVVISVAAGWWRRRLPALVAALAAYAVVLAPVLGFAQSGPQLVADRYSYLSCMGFAVVAGAAFVRFLGERTARHSVSRRALLTIVAAMALIGLEKATFAQCDHWQWSLSLWRRGVAVSPDSAIAHVNFADALAGAGAPSDAIDVYKRAILLNDGDAVAHDHLARAYVRVGEPSSAIASYLIALRIDPNRRNACFSLARLFRESGKAATAVKVLRDGIKRHPDDRGMMVYLATLLATHPDPDLRDGVEALRLVERVVDRNGARDPATALALADAHAEVGQFDAARQTAERALVLAETADKIKLAEVLRYRLGLFATNNAYRAGR